MSLQYTNKAGTEAAVNVFNTVEEVLGNLADYIVSTAAEAIAERDRFSIVLSGGSSPKRLYELLATPAYRNRIEWEKVYFFFGDERNVPQDDAESNYRMARLALFDVLEIDDSKVFPVDTALVPEKAALQYTKDIEAFFGKNDWNFDLVLLGLGDDAHTASLFPHTTAINEKTAAAKAVFLEEKQVYRITLTAPLINQAHHIAFLVYGDSKAGAFSHVMHDERNPEQYPAQLIAPIAGKLSWFLDKKAAAAI